MAPGPRDPPRGQASTGLCWVCLLPWGGGLQGGWWCHKWPKLCTREDSLMRSLPYLSPTLLLFHPLHWVSCSGLFSGARLGKEAFMRIVAKAYFFL